ncbi:MAG: transcription elongation factor GreA [Patescibacteria group bacterium]
MDNFKENQPRSDSQYLSREGFEHLKKELEHLQSAQRKEIAERMEYAKSLGDLSENAEYQTAKDDQLTNEVRIAQIEEILGTAVLISTEKSHGSAVDFGSTVMVKKDGHSEPEKYTIVGSEECDPFSQKISNDSPLGRALLRRKKGEEVTVHTPKGEIKYKILDIL